MLNQKEYSKQYYFKNRNKIINYSRNHYKNRTEEQEIKRKQSRVKYRNSIKGKLNHNRYRRKNIYSISEIEYKNLIQKQKNLCAICNCKCPTNKMLAIDHDHKTGKVRGLLCLKCNLGIGYFNDNIIQLNNAIKYLKHSI